jgi:predicted Mrr-cat superfamily restriction endonuclease
MTEDAQAWLVRSGTAGERDEWALANGVTPGGFDDVPDLSGCSSFDEVKALIAAALPEEKAGAHANFAAQLWTLLDRMKEGDYVAFPLKTSSGLDVAVGRIAGPYEYRFDEADLSKRHVRPVEWLSQAVPRSAFKQDLLNSLGAFLTYGALRAPDASRRLGVIVDSGEDPGGPFDGIPHSIEGLATWAVRVDESSDLEEEEHQYKREAATLMAQARDQARAGNSAWPTTFKKALARTNFVNFRHAGTLNAVIEANPDGALAAFEAVWSDPRVESLDAYQEAVGQLLGKVTPGNATAVGAFLLMADDPEANAPYSARRTRYWYQLTGFSDAEYEESASSRYQVMLDFLDALKDDVAERIGRPVSRLEAQGMAWATTESEPPAEWEAQEQQALINWRGRDDEAPRAWLARGKTSVIDWVEDDYVSLAASYLGSPAPGSSVAEIKAAIASGYQHQDAGQRKALVEEYYAFLSVMKPGDIVAAIHDARLHVGVVESPAEYEEQDGDRLRRAVLWQTVVPTSDLSSSVASLLDRQGSIVDITEGITDLQAILENPTAVVESGRLTLPAVDSALADELFMPQAALQEIVDLLDVRKQLVLYGPPGTGKTFVAKALARHIIGTDDPSRMQLVQFHPSYAYEDFFEGYRPSETESGQASFTLQPGPLARIAREARADKHHPYVLVIDEMNRANLAKVFGELYFLLEYRNESMQLQYRPTEAFRLPENLFIIGTMNTADRSIALLDAAMRRRFSFVELHPDEDPVKGVLPAWLAQGEHDLERAHLLQALNDAIEDQDRDLRIGPSYLMRDEASTEEGLRRVWKYDVMPLLEEHYYGRLTRDQIHTRFGLEALRGQIGGMSPTQTIEPEADDLFAADSSE